MGLNDTDWNICYPTCDSMEENECINGTCTAPGHCECFAGFELSNEANFTCVPEVFKASSIKTDEPSQRYRKFNEY